MDKQINGFLRFEGYKVEKLNFIANKLFSTKKSGKKAIELEFDLKVTMGMDEERNLAAVSLECIVFEDYEKNNKPFYLDVLIQGIFTYECGLKDEQIRDLLECNAVAILFPYLRSTISTITVNCGFPAVIIPTINVKEFLKDKQE